MMTKTPVAAFVNKRGIFLYDCSLLVPPSSFQMSTTWPFFN